MCGSVSGGGVCYSGDGVGSVAVYFCDDGYTLEGDTTRECLSSGLWSRYTPYCIEIPGEPTTLTYSECLKMALVCIKSTVIKTQSLCIGLSPSPLNIDIRLVNCNGAHEGLVEVCYYDEWKSVCDDDWSDEDANVVCGSLGFLSFCKCLHSMEWGCKED